MQFFHVTDVDARFLHLDAQDGTGWDQLPVLVSRIDSTQILGASTDSQGNYGNIVCYNRGA